MNTEALKAWFQTNKRPLPWRDQPTPYAVWISEVMLQQTQATVVIPYFERWMNLFPTVETLANATLDEVLKAWEGLGYYSRAKNLYYGAKHLLKEHQGEIPANKESLEKIKGLGPYTIGAILSFACRKRIPAVDGNVIRVLSRAFLIEEDMAKSIGLKKIYEKAQDLIADDPEPWVINEALIELGATVCTKKARCESCPLQSNCLALKFGKEGQLPHKSAKTKIEKLYRTVAVIEHEGAFLIKRTEEGQVMSGLHEFPYFDSISPTSLIKKLKTEWGLTVRHQLTLPTVKHSFTRYAATLYPLVFSTGQKVNISDYVWKTVDELKSVAFSSGHKRILEMIES